MAATLQEQIRANRLRTVLVLCGFALIVFALGLAISYAYHPSALGVAGIVGVVYGVFSWFASGQMIAGASGAKPVAKRDAPQLYRAVENASIGAGLPATPQVYLIDDPAPNAFAAGRTAETSYVAATTGLVGMLDERELEAVMAHEVGHIRNSDVRLMSLAAVLVGSIALIADLMMRIGFRGGGDSGRLGIIGVVVGIAAAILAPLFAALLQMALSRRREFLADAAAVEITGDALALASALDKLRTDTRPLRKVTRATAHLYIESPLRDHHGLRSSLGGLFDTHPPLQERIARLRELAGVAPARL